MSIACKSGWAERLLWAGVGPKDPSYPDVKFVNALIGPGTVATLPLQTLTALCDHGDPSCRQKDDLDAARAMPETHQVFTIDLEKVSLKLEGKRASTNSSSHLTPCMKLSRSSTT